MDWKRNKTIKNNKMKITPEGIRYEEEDDDDNDNDDDDDEEEEEEEDEAQPSW